MNTRIIYCLVLGIVLMISSCEKNGIKDSINSNSKVFKVSLFKSGLESQLSDAIGYAFVINQNGQWEDSTSFGIGRTDASSGTNVSVSALHDINIASVTKAFTSIAAIKLLAQKNISLDDSIRKWLPGYWAKSVDISNVTFRELLAQKSGIRQSNTSWDSLKSTAASQMAGSKTYSYANANFGLFRALLPKIKDSIAFNSLETNSTSFEQWMSSEYISIMQQLVFTPSGISNVICNIDPTAITMQALNQTNNPPLVPRNTGDWTELSGGGGFYMSTMEMARVMAFLVHTDNLLNNQQRTIMDDELLGWDPGNSFTTVYGPVYGKDGALFYDNNSSNSLDTGDSGLRTWVGKFPAEVELAISITSIGSSFRNMRDIIRTAYEGAWVIE